VVYAYPHVVSCRRNHPGYSWFRAYCHVVKNGGDSDRERITPARRRSLGKQQRTLSSKKAKKKNTRGGNSAGNTNSTSPQKRGIEARGTTTALCSPLHIENDSTQQKENWHRDDHMVLNCHDKEIEGELQNVGSESIISGEGRVHNSLFPNPSLNSMELDSILIDHVDVDVNVNDDDDDEEPGRSSLIAEDKNSIVSGRSSVKLELDFNEYDDDIL